MKRKRQALVTVMLGSQSDLSVMDETLNALRAFGVSYELIITSAHRSPQRTRQRIRAAEANGTRLFIAAAGGAAHLPGVVAAETALPVIGVPIDSSPLKGMDALLSIVQMPGGVPVASMAIGKAGAKNAAIFAAQCLALHDAGLARRLRQYKQSLVWQVLQQDQAVRGSPRGFTTSGGRSTHR